MTITLDQLENIFKTVGRVKGWDFSHVKRTYEPPPWRYKNIVRNYLKPTDRVLDIGTGGGERFLSLAPSFGQGIGIDIYANQVETAQQNKAEQGVTNVDFKVMDGHQLQFEDASFDVVLNRHAGITATEVVRVLRPGGHFITQQVGHLTSLNILHAFGWTPESFGDDWWQPANELAEEFEALNCRVIAQGSYNVRFRFLDIPSFIFWLTSVPFPEWIKFEQHGPTVLQFIQDNQTEQGIETNRHSELLIVQKIA